MPETTCRCGHEWRSHYDAQFCVECGADCAVMPEPTPEQGRVGPVAWALTYAGTVLVDSVFNTEFEAKGEMNRRNRETPHAAEFRGIKALYERTERIDLGDG